MYLTLYLTAVGPSCKSSSLTDHPLVKVALKRTVFFLLVNYLTLRPLSHCNKIKDKFGDPTTECGWAGKSNLALNLRASPQAPIVPLPARSPYIPSQGDNLLIHVH